MTAALASALVLLTGPAEGQSRASFRDGFETGGFDLSAWLPCLRPEAAFAVQSEVVRSGAFAAQATVAPLRDVALAQPLPLPFGLSFERKGTPRGCVNDDPSQPYGPDGSERAELRLQLQQRFGDDGWYGFSMFVGEAVGPADGARLVIGQWKQDGDMSPFVAQRFRDRHFHVTLQVPFGDGDCRILLAYEADYPLAEPDSRGQDGAVAGVPDCKGETRVERFAALPDPFGRWLDLVYHIRGSAGAGGIVELWVDGRPIARARGPIGHPPTAGPFQYFKFGPYRDAGAVDYATTAYLDNVSVGPSFAAVDPRRFDAPTAMPPR